MNELKPLKNSQESLQSAEELFRAGDFAEAERLYAEALAADPHCFQALVRLVYIALLANRLDEAQKWLTQAIELGTVGVEPRALLAEVFYHHDDFQHAPPLLHDIGQEGQAKNHIVIPFWMAGDHYMVAYGTVNKSLPLFLFVDIGLAGRGFTCSESTLKEAGIKLQPSRGGINIGGGGEVKTKPFVVEELTLSEATERNVRGLYMGDFLLERAFVFHIGDLISHSYFKPYALTLDFTGMRFFLERKNRSKT
ncbi:MAG: tetratricopeptide repeat protein [bacterium]